MKVFHSNIYYLKDGKQFDNISEILSFTAQSDDGTEWIGFYNDGTAQYHILPKALPFGDTMCMATLDASDPYDSLSSVESMLSNELSTRTLLTEVYEDYSALKQFS